MYSVRTFLDSTNDDPPASNTRIDIQGLETLENSFEIVDIIGVPGRDSDEANTIRDQDTLTENDEAEKENVSNKNEKEYFVDASSSELPQVHNIIEVTDSSLTENMRDMWNNVDQTQNTSDGESLIEIANQLVKQKNQILEEHEKLCAQNDSLMAQYHDLQQQFAQLLQEKNRLQEATDTNQKEIKELREVQDNLLDENGKWSRECVTLREINQKLTEDVHKKKNEISEVPRESQTTKDDGRLASAADNKSREKSEQNRIQTSTDTYRSVVRGAAAALNFLKEEKEIMNTPSDPETATNKVGEFYRDKREDDETSSPRKIQERIAAFERGLPRERSEHGIHKTKNDEPNEDEGEKLILKNIRERIHEYENAAKTRNWK